jgi:hypothetical protein
MVTIGLPPVTFLYMYVLVHVSAAGSEGFALVAAEFGGGMGYVAIGIAG